MSTSEIVAPPPPTLELSPEVLFQLDQDTLGSDRALLIGSSRLALVGLRRHSIVGRNPDDPTLIGNNYIEAQPEKTEEEIARFISRIANFREVQETFDEKLDQYGLNKPDAHFAILADHHMLSDIVFILKLLKSSEFGSSVPPGNVIAWISKMLPYADIKMPLPWAERAGSIEKTISPFASSALVVPDSPTMKEFREKHGTMIGKTNGDLARRIRTEQKNMVGPKIEVLASPQSQYKRYGDGLLQNLATPGSIKLIKILMKRGIPLFFIGAHTNPVTYHLPKIRKQRLEVAYAGVIPPDMTFKDDDDLALSVNERHFSTAVGVSPKKIYIAI